MSDDLPIGKILNDHIAERDAIHVAVIPVVAEHKLTPGQRIGLTPNGLASGTADKHIGIVDPFLTCDVRMGQRFFMFLFPNTVTGMRHHWRHPDVEDYNATNCNPDKEKARAILEQAAKRVGLSFDEVIEDMRTFLLSGHYRIEGGRWEGAGLWDNKYWDAYEIWTGKTAPDEDRGGVYSCSC